MKLLLFTLISFTLGALPPCDFVKLHRKGWAGWCSEEKACEMIDLILETHPQVCVEIGVYGGASLFPTAYALKWLGEGGVVYAIDPWRNEECIRFLRSDDPNYFWWSQVDLEIVRLNFFKGIGKYQLADTCVVLPEASHAVVEQVSNPIDILHIDGNHSEESSLIDTFLYLDKVRPGGYIWMNDVNWNDVLGNHTTRRAYNYLMTKCLFVKGNGNYALFRKL